DALAEAIATSPLPPGLERLDLSMGTMTDEGASLLLARAEELARLSAIALRGNKLSESMSLRVSRALPRAVAEQDYDVEEARTPPGYESYPCWNCR
ncbi:MAG: hypothetical protein KC431_08200, partial [Myxococcales bacterium]|nr:hypothetical protein [Myxococcales bacterium]